MGKKILFLLACMCMTASMAFAQRQITGTVVDSELGEPIVGASVKVQGTTMGAITDLDGKFTLNNVPSGSKTVVVSFMGMKTAEVTIRNNMNIILIPDVKAMDEVMVVAYGTAKKSAFTGSAGVINQEKIEARVTSNVSNALSGQVAGVQTFSSSGAPGSGSSVRIRGIGSMSASSSPLYIVDGAPYEGAISAINPQDIESITVLKDAAANAIYGARGANGVILVTTKKGKTQDAVVTLDAKWGSNSRAIPNYSHLGTAAYVETAYASLYNSKFYNGSTAAEAQAFANANIWNSGNGGLGTQIYTVPQGQLLIGTNGKLNPNATLGYSDGEFFYTPDDWYKALFSSSLRQEYNVNVSGRTDKMNYYASVGYLDDSGIVENSGFTRYSGRAKMEYQAKKWLRLGTNLAFSQNTSRETGASGDWGSSVNLFYVANMMAPIYPIYVRDAQGKIMYEPATGTPLYDNGATSTNGKRPFAGNSRVGAVYANDRDQTVSTTFNGNWFATIMPVDGLKMTADITQMEYNARYNYLSSIFGSSSTTEQGSASASHNRYASTNTRYTATYEHSFDNKHNFDVLFGYENYRLKMQSISAYNDHLFNPFIGEVNNAHGISAKRAGSSTTNYMTEGIIARAQYDYQQKYFASGSYRRDASSRFHPDNRWGNFGSVGFGWLLNKENFMEGTKSWLDELKVKASWGVQGNDNLNEYYPYIDQYSVSYSEETGEFSKKLVYKGNKDITWEHNQEWNTGVEFSLFKDRLSGSVEYFNRKTSDLLYNKAVPMTSGNPLGYYPTNIGSMRNSGVEVDLHAFFVKRKDVEWSFNLNMTHYKNKILELDESIDPIMGWVGSSTIRKVGGSLYNSFLVRFAGVDPETGQALYYKNPDGRGYKADADGNLILDANGNKIQNEVDWSTTANYDEAKQSDLGSTLPKVYGGFGSNFKYKGLDISFQMAYQLGGRAYDGNYEAMMHTGYASCMGQNWHKDILNAWTPENRNTDVPRICATDNSYQLMSDRFLVSSNYLALNNVTIGYTLPTTLTQRAKIGSVRIYVTGDNLCVISCRRGWDPRAVIGAGSSTGSATGANYTAMRNISAGVKVTF